MTAVFAFFDVLSEHYEPLPQPDALDQPNHTDLTRTRLSRLITMNELLEIWQKRGHPGAAGDHNDDPIDTHQSTEPLNFNEKRTTRAHGSRRSSTMRSNCIHFSGDY